MSIYRSTEHVLYGGHYHSKAKKLVSIARPKKEREKGGPGKLSQQVKYTPSKLDALRPTPELKAGGENQILRGIV